VEAGKLTEEGAEAKCAEIKKKAAATIAATKTVILNGAQRSEESLYGSRNEILRLRLRMTVNVFNRALENEILTIIKIADIVAFSISN